jgi:hypothetical protein
VPLCSPQIPHDLLRAWTRAAAVGSQRLTAWAMARLKFIIYFSFGAIIFLGRPRGRSSSPGSVKNFLFSTSSRPTLGPTQPPIQWVSEALSPGLKQLGREADHTSN